jgi:hypothetical protein
MIWKSNSICRNICGRGHIPPGSWCFFSVVIKSAFSTKPLVVSLHYRFSGSIEFWQKDSNSKQTIDISTTNGKDLVDTFNIPLSARNFNPCSNLFKSKFDRSRTNRTQLFSLVVAVVNNASVMFFADLEKHLNLFASKIIK